MVDIICWIASHLVASCLLHVFWGRNHNWSRLEVPVPTNLSPVNQGQGQLAMISSHLIWSWGRIWRHWRIEESLFISDYTEANDAHGTSDEILERMPSLSCSIQNYNYTIGTKLDTHDKLGDWAYTQIPQKNAHPCARKHCVVVFCSRHTGLEGSRNSNACSFTFVRPNEYWISKHGWSPRWRGENPKDGRVFGAYDFAAKSVRIMRVVSTQPIATAWDWATYIS